MSASNLINTVKNYCEIRMRQSICSDLPFHNWKHTQEVVAISKLLAEAENLSVSDTTALVIAAYFHDLGYINGSKNHEEISASKATEFLKLQGVDSAVKDTVVKTIKATSLNIKPQTKIQSVIRDADLAHLGQISYKEKNEKLREEWALLGIQDLSDKEWVLMNIEFLENHTYFTQTAKNLFSKQKKINLDDLHQLENELKAKL